jgi:hypothetical protein
MNEGKGKARKTTDRQTDGQGKQRPAGKLKNRSRDRRERGVCSG